MSNLDDYNNKLEKIEAIESDKVPNMPVKKGIKEAEDLYHWSKHDKKELVADGMDEAFIEDLSVRAGACREAESRWGKERKSREEGAQEWSEKAPDAFKFRDKMLRKLRHAYRKDAELTKLVRAIAEGYGNADMIQDLNDISVVGKDYPDGLNAIYFDLAQLDVAAAMSDEMGDLLGRANGDRKSRNPIKMIRDKAYAYMKEAVDEIRECGKFTFFESKKRLKGYSSDYFR